MGQKISRVKREKIPKTKRNRRRAFLSILQTIINSPASHPHRAKNSILNIAGQHRTVLKQQSREPVHWDEHQSDLQPNQNLFYHQDYPVDR